MLPDPLHPAIVHFPIALAMILPLFAIGAIWAIRRGSRARIAWGIAVLAFAAVALSGFLARQTGEQQEDRVERVVPEQPFESHEEAGEQFATAAIIVLVIAAIGFAPGMIGTAGRLAATAGSLVLVALIWKVGETGGDLVYEHGAASAYTEPGARGAPARGGDDDEASRTAGAASVASAATTSRATLPDSASRR